MPPVTFSLPDSGAPATMSVQVAGLADGVPVTFTVAAVSGSQVGTESAPTAPVVPSALPSAPAGLTIRQALSHLTLSWTAPSSNGGSALTAYTVTPYRDGVAQPAITVSAPSAATASSARAQLARESGVDPRSHMCVWL